jgi:hypothetical protein
MQYLSTFVSHISMNHGAHRRRWQNIVVPAKEGRHDNAVMAFHSLELRITEEEALVRKHCIYNFFSVTEISQ